MKKMKTLTINNVAYDITDDGAIRFDSEQITTEQQKAQARENIGAASVDDILTVADVEAMINTKLSNIINAEEVAY